MIDSANNFEVVPKDGEICVRKLNWRATREEALNLAAWLVATADEIDPERSAFHDFANLHREIRTR